MLADILPIWLFTLRELEKRSKTALLLFDGFLLACNQKFDFENGMPIKSEAVATLSREVQKDVSNPMVDINIERLIITLGLI